jgi:uncharacterized protein YndB with AHSA1/START domain
MKLAAAGLFTLALVAGSPTSADGPVTVTRVITPERALRFEVTVAGSLDDVWSAFTTREGLASWLWRDVRVEARPGGEWLAIFPQSTGGGTILSLTPKRQIVISALAPDRFPTVRETRTRATFEFSAVSHGATKVTLVQTGWKTGSEWDAAYDYLAGGNAELLNQLYQRFATGPIDWPKPR